MKKIDLTENEAVKGIRWSYVLLAFLLSLILWFYVTLQANPLEEKLYEVPVDYINLEEDLTISEKTDYVTVRVQSNSNILTNVEAKDISAYVNMSAAEIGTFTGAVMVDIPDNVQLVSISDSTVIITVEEVSQINKEVTINYGKAAVADGYMSMDGAVYPNTVTISGPSDKLEAIASVYVEVNLANMDSNYDGVLPVNVVDASGSSLASWIDVEPSNVEVLVPIVSNNPTKVVPVSPTIIGSVAEGYTITRTVVEPSVVTITGSQSAIDSINYAYTSAVDISNATTDIITQVKLLDNTGITYVDNFNSTINVIVVVEEEKTVTIENVAITVENANSDYNYDLQKSTISVKVVGPASVVEGLTNTDIVAKVDVSDAVLGENSLTLKGSTTANATITTLSSSLITVDVTEK